MTALRVANPTRLGDARLVLNYRQALMTRGASSFVPLPAWAGIVGGRQSSSARTVVDRAPPQLSAKRSQTSYLGDATARVTQAALLVDPVAETNNRLFADTEQRASAMDVVRRTTSAHLSLDLPLPTGIAPAMRLKPTHLSDAESGPVAKAMNKTVADPSDIAEWHRARRGPMVPSAHANMAGTRASSAHRHTSGFSAAASPKGSTMGATAGAGTSAAATPAAARGAGIHRGLPSGYGMAQNARASSQPRGIGGRMGNGVPSLDAMRAAVASEKAAKKKGNQKHHSAASLHQHKVATTASAGFAWRQPTKTKQQTAKQQKAAEAAALANYKRKRALDAAAAKRAAAKAAAANAALAAAAASREKMRKMQALMAARSADAARAARAQAARAAVAASADSSRASVSSRQEDDNPFGALIGTSPSASVSTSSRAGRGSSSSSALQGENPFDVVVAGSSSSSSTTGTSGLNLALDVDVLGAPSGPLFRTDYGRK